MRIVLADDHALFRDGVASLLEAWGHEVVGLRRRTAVPRSTSADELEPDLVLMDVRMPGSPASRRPARSPPAAGRSRSSC